jgi:hypothetical protein
MGANRQGLRTFIVLAGESGVLVRGKVVLVDVKVIIADPPLALIRALRGQICDASLQP